MPKVIMPQKRTTNNLIFPKIHNSMHPIPIFNKIVASYTRSKNNQYLLVPYFSRLIIIESLINKNQTFAYFAKQKTDLLFNVLRIQSPNIFLHSHSQALYNNNQIKQGGKSQVNFQLGFSRSHLDPSSIYLQRNQNKIDLIWLRGTLTGSALLISRGKEHILAQVQDLNMVAIADQTTEAKLNKSQIEKISGFCRSFVYFFDDAEHLPIENNANILRSKKNPQKEAAHIFRVNEKQLIVFSSNLSIQSDRQMIYDLKSKMKDFETEEMQLLEAIRGEISQSERNLALDFIIVNIWRTFYCQPTQVLAIINKFVMQQQANFNKKQIISQVVQNQRYQDKDPDMHFPEKMSRSKPCLRCKKIGIRKKISIKCQGCTVRRKKDIPLCPGCFGDFHQKAQFYYIRMGLGCRKKRKMFKSQNKELSVSGASNVQQLKRNSEKKEQMRIDDQEEHLMVESESDMMKNFKIKKLGTLFDEMFDSVQKLVQAKNSQMAKLFLKVCMIKYADKIRKISVMHPEHNNGLTRLIGLAAEKRARQDEQNRLEEKQKQQVIKLTTIHNEIVKKQQEYYQ